MVFLEIGVWLEADVRCRYRQRILIRTGDHACSCTRGSHAARTLREHHSGLPLKAKTVGRRSQLFIVFMVTHCFWMYTTLMHGVETDRVLGVLKLVNANCVNAIRAAS